MMILENENWAGRNAFFRGRTETSEESPGVNAGQADRRVDGLAYSKKSRLGSKQKRVVAIRRYSGGRQPLWKLIVRVRKNLDSGRSPWLRAIFESRL
jgi:hypothetical protein